MIFNLLKAGYNKVKQALSNARSLLSGKLKALFQGKIDEDTLGKLEQILYEADFGVQTAAELTQRVRELHKLHPDYATQNYVAALKQDLVELLKKYPSTLVEVPQEQLPFTILIVGVNGNGKTTSVAKLAHLFKQENKKPLVVAADTFRAAAIDQLNTWAERVGVDIVKGNPNSDPAAIAFDGISAAKARGCDVVLIDTAGRLHTKTHLMQELDKIKRACKKASQWGPQEVLLVLDATTGQNAIDQAKQFHQFTPITGLILTKVDGTAKGGIVIAIQREIGVPVKFIGVGESIDDLQPFDPISFVNNLFD